LNENADRILGQRPPLSQAPGVARTWRSRIAPSSTRRVYPGLRSLTATSPSPAWRLAMHTLRTLQDAV